MNKTISYINRGVELGQPRLLQRAIRQNVFLRRSVTKELLNASLTKFIPTSCPTYTAIQLAIQRIPDSSSQNIEQEVFLPPADAIPEVEVYGQLYSLFHVTLGLFVYFGHHYLAKTSAISRGSSKFKYFSG